MHSMDKEELHPSHTYTLTHTVFFPPEQNEVFVFTKIILHNFASPRFRFYSQEREKLSRLM